MTADGESLTSVSKVVLDWIFLQLLSLPRSHRNGPDPQLCRGTLLGATLTAAEASKARGSIAVHVFAGLERFGSWLTATYCISLSKQFDLDVPQYLTLLQQAIFPCVYSYRYTYI